MKQSSILVAIFALAVAVNVGQADQRGLFDSILGDTFNQAKTILKEVSAAVQAGDSPIKIFKDVVTKHPDIVNNLNLLTMACQMQTFQNIDYFGPACKFLAQNAGPVKELAAKYKEDAGAWIDFISKNTK